MAKTIHISGKLVIRNDPSNVVTMIDFGEDAPLARTTVPGSNVRSFSRNLAKRIRQAAA